MHNLLKIIMIISVVDEEKIRRQANDDGVTHISTGIAVKKGEKVLIVRRSKHDFLGGNYELPGGGVNEGETITEGIIRELKEETGLKIDKIICEFAGFDYSTKSKPKVRQVNVVVEVLPGEITLDSNEHDDYQWVDLSNFRQFEMTDNMQDCVKNALQKILNK